MLLYIFHDFSREPAALEFVSEAYKHAKAIAASGAGTELLRSAHILNGSAPDSKKKQERTRDEAVVVAQGGGLDKMVEDFIKAIGKHRNWQRERLLRPDLQWRTERLGVGE
jgi:catalase